MPTLIESYEQQYAVLTAEITSEIGKLKRSPAGTKEPNKIQNILFGFVYCFLSICCAFQVATNVMESTILTPAWKRFKIWYVIKLKSNDLFKLITHFVSKLLFFD